MSTPDPESNQQLPVVTHLEGFPDPVRDPDTGMIVPQTRKERRALEAAQARMRAKRQARQQQTTVQTSELDEAAEDLDFGSDRKSTRLNSSHVANSYAVFCLNKKKRFRSAS